MLLLRLEVGTFPAARSGLAHAPLHALNSERCLSFLAFAKPSKTAHQLAVSHCSATWSKSVKGHRGICLAAHAEAGDQRLPAPPFPPVPQYQHPVSGEMHGNTKNVCWDALCDAISSEDTGLLSSPERPTTEPMVLFIDGMNHIHTSQTPGAPMSSVVDNIASSIITSASKAHGSQWLVYISLDDPLQVPPPREITSSSRHRGLEVPPDQAPGWQELGAASQQVEGAKRGVTAARQCCTPAPGPAAVTPDEALAAEALAAALHRVEACRVPDMQILKDLWRQEPAIKQAVLGLVSARVVAGLAALQQRRRTHKPWLLIVDHQQPAVHHIMHSPHTHTGSHSSQLLEQLAQLLVLPHDQGEGDTKVLLLLARLAGVLSADSHLLPISEGETVRVHINANDSDIIVGAILTQGLLSPHEARQLQVQYAPKGDVYEVVDISMASQAVVKLPIVGDAHSVPRYITFALYYLLMGSDMVPGTWHKGPTALELVLKHHTHSKGSSQQLPPLPFPTLATGATPTQEELVQLLAAAGAIVLHTYAMLYAVKLTGKVTFKQEALRQLDAGGAALFLEAAHHLASAAVRAGVQHGSSQTAVLAVSKAIQEAATKLPTQFLADLRTASASGTDVRRILASNQDLLLQAQRVLYSLVLLMEGVTEGSSQIKHLWQLWGYTRHTDGSMDIRTSYTLDEFNADPVLPTTYTADAPPKPSSSSTSPRPRQQQQQQQQQQPGGLSQGGVRRRPSAVAPWDKGQPWKQRGRRQQQQQQPPQP